MDKLARHRWRRYTLIVITTDERLAATAPPAGFWDAPQHAELEYEADDMM